MGEFSGKTLLITGGTGSFGNAVLHRKVAFIPQAFPVGFTPQFIT